MVSFLSTFDRDRYYRMVDTVVFTDTLSACFTICYRSYTLPGCVNSSLMLIRDGSSFKIRARALR